MQQTSLAAGRFARRLLEITKEFDKNKTMKYLLVRPNMQGEEWTGRPERAFYEELFAEKSFLLPLSFPQDSLQPQSAHISFYETTRKLLRSPTLQNLHDKDKELAMWNILKTLLTVLTCYESAPPKGFLYDEKTFEYASEPVRGYMEAARRRLEQKETRPLVELTELQKGATLIAHPLQMDEQWRHTAVQIFSSKKGKHSYSSAFILNYYNRAADTFIRQGGGKVEGFSLHVYDSNLNPTSAESQSESPEVPEGEKGTSNPTENSPPLTKGDKARGITYTFEAVPGVDSEEFLGTCFFGDGLEQDIRQGKWIPVLMEKEMILDAFRFKSLTSLECNMLKRMYWEEILRHLGGEFENMADLANNYHQATYLKIGL